MSKEITNFAKDLASHLQYTDYTRQRMEKFLRQGIIARRDIEQVYFGLYMDAITSFEAFLENLFLRLLVEGKINHGKHITPQVTFKSLTKAREILFGGHRYLNWLPYDSYTLKRAKVFFRGGRPFSELDNEIDKNLLREMSHIRNALAHPSDHAQRKFEQNVLSNYSVSSLERKPIKFLRSMHIYSPRQRKYDMYIIQLIRQAHKICR